jgi:hypothetical protein
VRYNAVGEEGVALRDIAEDTCPIHGIFEASSGRGVASFHMPPPAKVRESRPWTIQRLRWMLLEGCAAPCTVFAVAMVQPATRASLIAFSGQAATHLPHAWQAEASGV